MKVGFVFAVGGAGAQYAELRCVPACLYQYSTAEVMQKLAAKTLDIMNLSGNTLAIQASQARKTGSCVMGLAHSKHARD